MANRQGSADPDQRSGSGRAAQRRRTRAAIIAAASRLLADGADPSIDEIAVAADVSRRTVYLYFPTLDQLLLDAAVGALTSAVDPVIGAGQGGVQDRVDALITSLLDGAEQTLPLGRKIIQLTVAAPDAVPEAGSGAVGTDAPRRGFRRLQWIEQALEPMRGRLSGEQHERLTAALSIIAGWESMIVLRDVCGLPPDRERAVLRWVAASLVQSMLTEAGSHPDDGPGAEAAGPMG